MSKASRARSQTANAVIEPKPKAAEVKPRPIAQVPEMLGGIEPLPLPPRNSLIRRLA